MGRSNRSTGVTSVSQLAFVILVLLLWAIPAAGQIINFTSKAAVKDLILHTTVTIGYDAPWRTVHSLLIEAAKATENIIDEPEPFVLQKTLHDFFVEYELNAYTKKPRRIPATYSELHENIQDRFNEAGVEILSPHFRTHRQDDQEVT